MEDEINNSTVPNWLENLEKLREKRVTRRLGHETGAGAPCLNCADKCPGLDLHFWRKICKVCKCSKDSHNVEDDDTCGWVQFQLLGTKPIKSKGIKLPGNIQNQSLEFTPPGANSTVERYLNELPTDEIPLSGTDAAKKRQSRLQNQIPAHDLDATLCDSLTPIEQNKMQEYVSHIKQHCVGQGKLIELPIYTANLHEMNKPCAKIVSDHLPLAHIVNSEEVNLKTAALANDLSNLNLHNKKNKHDPNLGQNAEIGTYNSNTYQQCHSCQEPFTGGEIVISVSRTDAQWHPKCFKCHSCDQVLEDLVYFYDKKTKNIYCGRDYAAIRGIPRCGACDELIFLREYCLAENRAFHVKHFCCWECDVPLAGQEYLMDGPNPMCITCFEQLKAAKCRHCGLIIGPQQQGVSLDNMHWHTPECFVCHHCLKSLVGTKKWLLREQQIYCSAPCVALAST
ncbi:testin [Chrysoperla carnea]|uniref:testin n=1 Tax=Chrysoperla carnea TaxID=189513 RepID=UPI001D09603E|nr:testin [Chrysoperla carnea]